MYAIAVWFGLPNDPGEVYFLSEEEKDMMRCRAKQRKKYMGSDKFDWEDIQIEFRDPKLYLKYVFNRDFYRERLNTHSGAIQCCQDILLYGFRSFLPSILKAVNYNTLQSN